MKRLARILGTLMILGGLGTLAWAVTVWQWQDPVTAVVNGLEQRKLDRALDRRFELAKPLPLLPTAPATAPAKVRAADAAATRKALAAAAREWRRSSARGEAIARIKIPAIGLDAVVVDGTDHESLKRGPGRYLKSAMPGEGELVYIAGHRTTYGAPFSRIDRIKRGDRVELELPYATITYEVTGHRIVSATNLAVLRSKGREQLALQACHPRFFATQRWITYAKPVEIVPRGGSGDVALAAAG